MKNTITTLATAILIAGCGHVPDDLWSDAPTLQAWGATTTTAMPDDGGAGGAGGATTTGSTTSTVTDDGGAGGATVTEDAGSTDIPMPEAYAYFDAQGCTVDPGNMDVCEVSWPESTISIACPLGVTWNLPPECHKWHGGYQVCCAEP